MRLQQGCGELDLLFLGVVVRGRASQLGAADRLVLVLSREGSGAAGWEPRALG